MMVNDMLSISVVVPLKALNCKDLRVTTPAPVTMRQDDKYHVPVNSEVPCDNGCDLFYRHSPFYHPVFWFVTIYF